MLDIALRADLAHALTDSGRILDRDIDRLAFAADASHYALTPRAAVLAASVDEVAAVLGVATWHSIPVTFRSGGTSLSGQAITDGLLVETKRHFRGIEILDEGARVAVGVGLTLREVNARLAPLGRMLGPDPASESACTIGGVVANNSSGMACGTHANTYRTLDAMVFVLPSGTVVDTSAPFAEAALCAREPELYVTISRLRDRIRRDASVVAEIRRQFSMKNTMGYSVNAFVDHESVVEILAHLMVGSEGTLGFVARAVFRTLPVRPHIRTGLLVFADLRTAAEAVEPLVGSGARAVELIDAASLRVAQRDPAAGPELHELSVADHTALLVEYQEGSAAELAERGSAAERTIAGLDVLSGADLTDAPGVRSRLWRVRKGLFTAVAGARASGTTSLLEDIAVPGAALPDTCAQLRELFSEHGYGDAAIFGHARDANLHFLVTQSFASAADLARYERFTADLVDLVLARGGTLKAEHGTGRVMAPFVRRQFGDELYEVMRAVKRSCDPARVLNPGVVITDDEREHLRNLKVVPTVDPEVDKCVECGYCEPSCPSRTLTTTPRQRIVLRRAMAALHPDDPLRTRLADDYDYAAIDTCAADGMCATNCPVGINTGLLMKRLRAERHGPVAEAVGAASARHLAGTAALARTGLAAGHLLPSAVPTRVARAARRIVDANTVPAWSADLPTASKGRPGPNRPADPIAAVFFPSCLDAIFAPAEGGIGVARALELLVARADVNLLVPEGINSLCCATPWRSKGLVRGSEAMTAKVLRELWAATEHGKLPVISDASSCTHGLAELAATAAVPEGSGQLRMIDSTTFAAQHLLPRLRITSRRGSLAVHPTCSTTHLDATTDLLAIAEAIADEVVVPQSWGCCGFAGDRGMLFPELTAAATREQASEVNSRSYDGYASANRTCEIGMSRATGRTYRHILEFLEEATR